MFLLLAPAMLLGEEAAPDKPPQDEDKPTLGSVLQPPSTLSGVMFPSYDAQLRLTSVLRVKTVTLVDKEVLEGETVNVRLYHPDRSARGTLDLTRASFDQIKKKVRSAGSTKLTLGRMTTTATGLYLNVTRAEGFLTGPVSTRLQPAPVPATAMNPRVSPLRAAAVLGAALIAQPLAAAPAETAPPAPTPLGEIANRPGLEAALDASTAVTDAAKAYLKSENLLAQTGPAAAIPHFEPKALDASPGKDDTVIDCDGGTYFDGEQGVLAYLGNVSVRNPGYRMSGANELKAFFIKKPAPAADKAKPAADQAEPAADQAKPAAGKDPAAGLGGEEWELARIVATGAVYFKQEPKPGETAIEASGAIFSYHAATDTITLSGGQPWIRRGGIINRAKRADQTLTIVKKTEKKDGKDVDTYSAEFSPGGTETILPTKELERQKNKKVK